MRKKRSSGASGTASGFRSFDTQRRHKDGSLVDVAVTVSPVRDQDGVIVGASKMARDISARKRMEAKDAFLVAFDDLVRPLTDAEEITFTAAQGARTASVGEPLRLRHCRRRRETRSF